MKVKFEESNDSSVRSIVKKWTDDIKHNVGEIPDLEIYEVCKEYLAKHLGGKPEDYVVWMKSIGEFEDKHDVIVSNIETTVKFNFKDFE